MFTIVGVDDDIRIRESIESLVESGFVSLVFQCDHSQLPVIFISGHQNDRVRRKALEGSAFAFMNKMFDPGDLLEAVNRATSNCSHV